MPDEGREIRDILLTSYTGVLYWRGGAREEAFKAKLDEGVEHCVTGELIETGRRGLEATPLGRLAATKGITVDTAIDIAAFVRENADRADSVDPFEVLWRLSTVHGIMRVRVGESHVAQARDLA